MIGALLSLHVTCLSFLPVSSSFIIYAQSGRFRGRDFNISNVFLCADVNSGKSLIIVRLGGGGGGRGGGGGGIAALDELLDSVGAPKHNLKSQIQ